MIRTRVSRANLSSQRSDGLTLVEIALTIALLGMIMIGVMASLSTGFLAQRSNSDLLETQLLAREVLEEVQSTPYDSLLSFNGTSVTSGNGKCQASISAATAGTGLVRIAVASTCVANPSISSNLVTQIADLE